MALRILKSLGFAYEVLPIFCALVKIANRNESVILQALHEGDYNNYFNLIDISNINTVFSYEQEDRSTNIHETGSLWEY